MIGIKLIKSIFILLFFHSDLERILADDVCCYGKETSKVNSNCSCSFDKNADFNKLDNGDELFIDSLSNITGTPFTALEDDLEALRHLKYILKNKYQINLYNPLGSYKRFPNSSVILYLNENRYIFPAVYYFCFEVPMKVNSYENIHVHCPCRNVANENESCCREGIMLFFGSDYLTDIWNCSMEIYNLNTIEYIQAIEDSLDGGTVFMYVRNNYSCEECYNEHFYDSKKSEYVIVEGIEKYNSTRQIAGPLFLKESYYCHKYDEETNGDIPDQHFICGGSRNKNPTPYVEHYLAMNILCAFFHSITLLVFFLFPKTKKSMKSKIIICQSVSFMILNATNLRYYGAMGQLPPKECIITAYMTHFWSLAGTFWINVLCIDMAWTFSGTHFYRSEKRKFLYYSLYAWGIPIIITAVTAVLGFVEINVNSTWRPQISYSTCWFHQMKAMVIYHYGPVLLLTLANGPLLMYTTYKISRVVCASSNANNMEDGENSGSNSKMQANKKRFIIYMNLALLIGAPRILAFIKLLTYDELIMLIVNITSMMRSVFMFLFVCCSLRVGPLVKQRLQSWVFKITHLFRTGCLPEQENAKNKEDDCSYFSDIESTKI